MPFKDKIVYDDLLSGYHISFGGGIKRMRYDSYRRRIHLGRVLGCMWSDFTRSGERSYIRSLNDRHIPCNQAAGRSV